jgi:hypothetical protein
MNTCFFCGLKPADSAHTFQQPLYHFERYAHLGVVRRFEYSKVTVPIERCAECAQNQKKAKGQRKRVITLWAVGGFIIGLFIPGAFLFTAIIGGFLGYVIVGMRQKRSLKNSGLKGLDPASLSMHAILGDKLRNGWTMKKP